MATANHAKDKMTLPLAVINTHLGYGINRYEKEPPINSASNHKMYTPVTLYITCTLDFLSSSAAKGNQLAAMLFTSCGMLCSAQRCAQFPFEWTGACYPVGAFAAASSRLGPRYM